MIPINIVKNILDKFITNHDLTLSKGDFVYVFPNFRLLIMLYFTPDKAFPQSSKLKSRIL